MECDIMYADIKRGITVNRIFDKLPEKILNGN